MQLLQQCIQSFNIPYNWPVSCPQDISLTHKTAPWSVQPASGAAEKHWQKVVTRRFDRRKSCLLRCGGVDCQVTIWCHQTQPVVQWSFFYEGASRVVALVLMMTTTVAERSSLLHLRLPEPTQSCKLYLLCRYNSVFKLTPICFLCWFNFELWVLVG